MLAWRLVGSAWLLFGAAAFAPAFAEPSVAEDSSYYDVVGQSLPDLVEQMRYLGPQDAKSGKRYWAYTHWYVRWRYTYRYDASSCSIDTLSVTVEVKYTYPQWKNEAGADESARQAWDRMMSAIERHERQHGQNGKEAAREIERSLGDLARRGTCDVLGRDANALGYDIIKKYNARDVEFDRRTIHGRAEGVHLP